jgi:hypothetical protein
MHKDREKEKLNKMHYLIGFQELMKSPLELFSTRKHDTFFKQSHTNSQLNDTPKSELTTLKSSITHKLHLRMPFRWHKKRTSCSFEMSATPPKSKSKETGGINHTQLELDFQELPKTLKKVDHSRRSNHSKTKRAALTPGKPQQKMIFKRGRPI